MEKLQAVIVDDEQGALDVLNHLLNQSGFADVIALESNSLHVEGLIDRLQPDLLFLDVEMPSINGLDLLARIREQHPNLHIIMVSAHDGLEYQAVKYNVYSYLLKPVNRYELNTLLERLYNQKHQLSLRKDRKIKLPVKDGYIFVLPEELFMMKMDGSGTEILTCDEKVYQSSYDLECLIGRLPEGKFLRINRSTVLNESYLHKINRSNSTCVVKCKEHEYTLDLSSRFIKVYDEQY